MTAKSKSTLGSWKRTGVVAAMAVISMTAVANAAWYDDPAVLRLVPLATDASTTEDPHFMNKSADDKTLLVNMQASGDNDGPILLDIDEIASLSKQDVTFRKVFAKPSAIGGAQFKGGAVSSDLGLAILGSGKADLPRCAFMTAATSWQKDANLFLHPATDIAMDGVDFGTDSTYLYSNIYDGGGIARFNVGKTGALSGKVTKATTAARVRNISVHRVNGRELVYFGEGADGTSAAKIYAMDVTDADVANWTETELKLGDAAITIGGVVTNVKLSNEDTEEPILYALTDDGLMTIWKLAADGLSVAAEVKSFTADQMKALAGGTADSTAKFRNFEVTKDGKTAFLINRTDTHNVSLAVLQAQPAAYIESMGVARKGIDIGYRAGPDTAIWADFAFMGNNPVSQYFIFESGSDPSSVNAYLRSYINGNTSYAAGTRCYAFAINKSGWTSTGVPVIPGERHQILLDSFNGSAKFVTGATVKNWNLASYTATTNSNSSIKLFCKSSMTGNYAEMRLYGFRIYEKGVLVRDYVPCKRGDAIGVYETFTKRFFAGAGNMTASAGVMTIDEPNDEPYLESSYKSMNLDYYANPQARIEVDFALTNTDANKGKCLCGLYDGKCAFSTLMYLNGDGYFVSTMRDGTWKENGFSPALTLDTNRHVWIIDGWGGYYEMTDRDGAVQGYKTMASEARTKTSLWPMTLFGSTTGEAGAGANAVKQQCAAKVYRVRIYERGSLIYDYTPAKQDGIPGLKCAITGKFLPGPGLTLSENAPEATESDPYIESSGTTNAFMNTGFIVTGKSKIEVDFAYTNVSVKQHRVFGNDIGGVNKCRHSVYINNSFCIALAHGDSTFKGDSTGLAADTQRHRVILDFKGRTKTYWSGTTKLKSFTMTEQEMATNFVKTATVPTALFGSPASASGVKQSLSHLSKTRIFSAKFWEDDELVHDFEPCVRGGVPGFKDLVTGKFITGENVSAFTANNVTRVEDEDPALVITGNDQKTGKRYIDTGYYYTDKTRVELDYALSENYKAAVSGNGTWYAVSARTTEMLPEITNDWMFAIYYIKQGMGYFAGNSRWTMFADFECPITGKDIRRLAVLDNAQMCAYVQTAGYTNAVGYYTDVPVGTASKAAITIAGSELHTSGFVPLKIYGFRIYEDGVLVRNYRPFMQAGEVKLQDTLSGATLGVANYDATYVTPQGEVNAPAEVDVSGMRTDDAYIQSDGTQVINLGYFAKPTSRFEVDYQLLDETSQARVFGATGGGTACGLSAEFYVNGSSNMTFGVGDTWKNYSTGMKSTTTTRRLAILDCYHKVCSVSGLKSMNITSSCTKESTYPMCVFAKSTSSGNVPKYNANSCSKCRIYAFRIFEADELVHEYLPYKNGDVVGLYDTVTGEVKTNFAEGANALVYCGEGAYDYRSDPTLETALVIKPQKTIINRGKTATLKAYAPGAVGYVWKMNGVEIVGENSGELTVYWQRHKGAATSEDRYDAYTVAPVFLIGGELVVGKEAWASVLSNPLGLAIFVN